MRARTNDNARRIRDTILQIRAITRLTLAITVTILQPRAQQVAFAKNTIVRTMAVPIITNPMKLRQKLSESASQGPTPFPILVQSHSVSLNIALSAELEVSFLSSTEVGR